MLFAILALAAAQALATGAPAFEPRKHKSEIAGRPAQVLVLGTMHLSQLPEGFNPKLLDPLLDRLVSYKPQIITIEDRSAEDCEILRLFQARYGADTYNAYCSSMDEIEKATGLDVPAASARVDEMLATWPASPTPARRRHLAMLFLAAGDRASALVQWLRLPEADRHAGDGLTEAMVRIIERKGKPLNEDYAIAAVLAARLGLERVYPVDDQTAGWAMDKKTEDAFGEAVEAAWKEKPNPVVERQDQLEKHLRTGADVLRLYRLLNAPETQRQMIAADMGRNARYPSAALYGRQYVDSWEARNLRIAANIRLASARHPQARVLSIIGATHKGYLDAYLNMMQDIRLVDAEQFLK